MSGLGDVNAFSVAAREGGASAPAAGARSSQKDKKTSETAPQFGDVLKRIQSQYGAKTEKPREIKKTLGKDDFLKIMITQMQHQDPTSPFKAEQMASEMAQFTSVEQLQNMNQSLQKMSQQSSPADRMAMTGLIGKTVTIDKDRFPHTDGQNEVLTFNLPRESKETNIALVSETGEVILEKELGAQKKGEGVFQWDGLKTNGLPAKTGNYILRVEAKDEHGNGIPMDPRARARVIGVSFEGSEPVLLVGDAKNQAKVALKSIVKVESEPQTSAAAPPSAPPEGVAGGESAQDGKSDRPNFIAFKKGEGSSPIDPDNTSPEVAAALAKYGQPQNALAPPEFRPVAEPQKVSEKAPGKKPESEGFPNGLQD